MKQLSIDGSFERRGRRSWRGASLVGFQHLSPLPALLSAGQSWGLVRTSGFRIDLPSFARRSAAVSSLWSFFLVCFPPPLHVCFPQRRAWQHFAIPRVNCVSSCCCLYAEWPYVALNSTYIGAAANNSQICIPFLLSEYISLASSKTGLPSLAHFLLEAFLGGLVLANFGGGAPPLPPIKIHHLSEFSGCHPTGGFQPPGPKFLVTNCFCKNRTPRSIWRESTHRYMSPTSQDLLLGSGAQDFPHVKIPAGPGISFLLHSHAAVSMT